MFEPPHVVGSLTLNQHCTFIWREYSFGEVAFREVEVRDHHFERCIQGIERLGMRIDDLRDVRIAG